MSKETLNEAAQAKLVELIEANGGVLPPGVLVNTITALVKRGVLEPHYQKVNTWERNAVSYVIKGGN